MTILDRITSWWLRRRPLPEPDLARLNFLGSGYRVSNGELDNLADIEIVPQLLDLKFIGPRWVIIVMPTRERNEQWWVHYIMCSFGPPVTRIDLTDGRLAFCTWGVPVR